MSLRLFLATGSAQLTEFDALGVDTDSGAPFDTTLTAHPIADGASGDFKLRRIVQWVTLGSDAVVAITPIADGVVQSDQRYVLPLALSGGGSQRLEVPCSVRGRRFAVQVDVLSGVVSVGEAELVVLPKRSLTGGDL